LVNPKNGDVVQWLPAKEVFDLMVTSAWKTGDPGIVFLDRINRDNPTPQLGEMESTNPCGEQPLLPYEPCNLGSINLVKFFDKKSGEMDWDRLKKIVHKAVHFLDNVVTMNRYPLPEIHKMAVENRRIGLGVMGWADLLLIKNVPYDSREAGEFGEEIMKFINIEGKQASINLAKERGVFQNWKGSSYDVPGGPKMRNSTITTIAPTGTISMIADCSSGIEPIFAIVYIKNVMDGQELLYINPYFEKVAKERGFHSEALMRKVAEEGSIQEMDEVPDDVKKVFVTAQDIKPKWHMEMQAAFQRHTDNAVSKTINFAHEAGIEDVREAYQLAFKFGLKGVTIFRDGSRDQQVLQTGKTKNLLKNEQVAPQSSNTIKENILSIAQNRSSESRVATPAVQMEIPVTVEGGLLRDWMDHQRKNFKGGSLKNGAAEKASQEAMSKLKEKITVTASEGPGAMSVSASTQPTVCPECSSKLSIQEGCAVCNSCGFSYCHN